MFGRRRPRLWRAPAKVNLTLHILGRRADGWHELDSVVAFAGCCDWLSFEPAEPLSLSVDGPTAQAAGESDDNLVLRAARALQRSRARNPARAVSSAQEPAGRRRPWRRLVGRGGGAARARRMKTILRPTIRACAPPREATGADVPVCLDPRARRMSGLGEKLGPLLRLPPLFAVLVNPRVAVATPAVFARLGLAKGAPSGLGASPSPPAGAGSAGDDRRAARWPQRHAAGGLRARAGDFRTSSTPCRRPRDAALVRMSGSGATCFALFDDRPAAARAAREIARTHPGWWVRPTILR